MDSRYTYAVGYIRALENKLLSGALFEKLISSGTRDSFLKGLEPTQYSGRDGFERELEEKSLGLAKLVRKLMLDDLLKEIVALRYDYINLSAVLGAGYAGGGADPALREGKGGVPTAGIKAAVLEGKHRRVPADMASAISEAGKAFERTDDPALAIIGAERAYFDGLGQRCGDSGSMFFAGYASAAADIYNIKVFFRIQKMGGSAGALSAALTEAGSLAPEIFTSWHKAGKDRAAPELAHTPYDSIVGAGLACLAGDNPLAALEVAGDGFLYNFMARANGVVMGPEPVFAYYHKAEHELKVLRMIIAGIEAGAPPEIIRGRVYLPS